MGPTFTVWCGAFEPFAAESLPTGKKLSLCSSAFGTVQRATCKQLLPKELMS